MLLHEAYSRFLTNNLDVVFYFLEFCIMLARGQKPTFVVPCKLNGTNTGTNPEMLLNR